MQNITKNSVAQFLAGRLNVLVLLTVLVLALSGQMPESQAGWITSPPRVVILSGRPVNRARQASSASIGTRLRHGWHHVARTWHLCVTRSVLLGLLWWCSGPCGPSWVVLWPTGLWLWQTAGVIWPELRRQPEWRAGRWLLWQGHRLLLGVYLGLALHAGWQGLRRLDLAHLSKRSGGVPVLFGLGCQSCGREEPRVEIVGRDDGGYQVTLCGRFTLELKADPDGTVDSFRKRLLLVFLRLLEVPGAQRGSRRTRDGRTPFVRQQQLAEGLAMPQPNISRIEGYWLEGDWANLLSLHTPEVLTVELVGRIVTVLATFPHWSVEEVCDHLQEQGTLVTKRQVRQAAQQSGWTKLQQALRRRYQWCADLFRPKDDWLLQEALGLIETLLQRLEAGQGLPQEEQIAIADLRALAREAGVVLSPPIKALPWLLRVERVVFGHWEEVLDETIRCPDCGSTQVRRKSRQGRMKKFYDEAGNLQEVAVDRYYCGNPGCPRKTFTHFPPGLVPYSRHRLEVHLLALQAYAWSYSTYRRVGQSLGVAQITVYRWVSAWGHRLLPVGAIFGLVRSSGVVGVDEKHVLVPKNDKPAGKRRRWMYVYLAVDAYTLDLLYIAIYPHNTRDSARAFLLALRAKGYHPKVIVTDLRQDYGPVVAQVFCQAEHHQCIFHALQEVQRDIREVYGSDYRETHPEVVLLRKAIEQIFEAKTKRTAYKRYLAVQALREQYVTADPQSQVIFDFLQRHWPSLVNAVESQIIPTTNNAVERVIGRFDQHYQGFRGFESIETAKVYLGVFEKLYRFTPFSDDAQPETRGKSPLELTGYDLSQVPMAVLCRGLSPQWPTEVIMQKEVPNL